MGSDRLVWKRGKVAICCEGKDGEKEEALMPGQLAGPFGAHKWKEDWHLTHLATGLRITTEGTLLKLKEKAQQLVDQTTGGVEPWANPDPLSVRDQLTRAGARVLGKRFMSSAAESGIGFSP